MLLVNDAIVAQENQTTSRDIDFADAYSTHAQISKATHDSCAETFEVDVTARYFTSAAFIPQLAGGRTVLHFGRLYPAIGYGQAQRSRLIGVHHQHRFNLGGGHG